MVLTRFSKPLCKYPISVKNAVIVSPSIATKFLIVPCDAGCDGPTFKKH